MANVEGGANPLEILAQEKWAEHVDNVLEASGGLIDPADVPMHELVALGFIVDDDGGVVWYPLVNSAALRSNMSDGRGEFMVDGMELERVLRLATGDQVLQDAVLAADGVVAAIDVLPRVLWHTHVNTVEPSAEDMAEFPEWLAQLGMVYHIPSGTTTVYNATGVLSKSAAIIPNNPAAAEPLATTQD